MTALVTRLRSFLQRSLPAAETASEPKDMWLYQFIMRPPHGCYKWSCFCSGQELIRHLHLLILKRLCIKPVQENVKVLHLPPNLEGEQFGINFFDPFQVVPVDARQEVLKELINGMLMMEPLLEQLDPVLDEEPLKVFRRLVRIVQDGSNFRGPTREDSFKQLRSLFGEGWIAGYLDRMYEHYMEGKRRAVLHELNQRILAYAGMERRAKDGIAKAERDRKRVALKQARDRDRILFSDFFIDSKMRRVIKKYAK